MGLKYIYGLDHIPDGNNFDLYSDLDPQNSAYPTIVTLDGVKWIGNTSPGSGSQYNTKLEFNLATKELNLDKKLIIGARMMTTVVDRVSITPSSVTPLTNSGSGYNPNAYTAILGDSSLIKPNVPFFVESEFNFTNNTLKDYIDGVLVRTVNLPNTFKDSIKTTYTALRWDRYSSSVSFYLKDIYIMDCESDENPDDVVPIGPMIVAPVTLTNVSSTDFTLSDESKTIGEIINSPVIDKTTSPTSPTIYTSVDNAKITMNVSVTNPLKYSIVGLQLFDSSGIKSGYADDYKIDVKVNGVSIAHSDKTISLSTKYGRRVGTIVKLNGSDITMDNLTSATFTVEVGATL